jgi:hypothetical protein
MLGLGLAVLVGGAVLAALGTVTGWPIIVVGTCNAIIAASWVVRLRGRRGDSR